jgi:hypothetical protein
VKNKQDKVTQSSNLRRETHLFFHRAKDIAAAVIDLQVWFWKAMPRPFGFPETRRV